MPTGGAATSRLSLRAPPLTLTPEFDARFNFSGWLREFKSNLTITYRDNSGACANPTTTMARGRRGKAAASKRTSDEYKGAASRARWGFDPAREGGTKSRRGAGVQGEHGQSSDKAPTEPNTAAIQSISPAPASTSHRRPSAKPKRRGVLHTEHVNPPLGTSDPTAAENKTTVPDPAYTSKQTRSCAPQPHPEFKTYPSPITSDRQPVRHQPPPIIAQRERIINRAETTIEETKDSTAVLATVSDEDIKSASGRDWGSGPTPSTITPESKKEFDQAPDMDAKSQATIDRAPAMNNNRQPMLDRGQKKAPFRPNQHKRGPDLASANNTPLGRGPSYAGGPQATTANATPLGTRGSGSRTLSNNQSPHVTNFEASRHDSTFHNARERVLTPPPPPENLIRNQYRTQYRPGLHHPHAQRYPPPPPPPPPGPPPPENLPSGRKRKRGRGSRYHASPPPKRQEPRFVHDQRSESRPPKRHRSQDSSIVLNDRVGHHDELDTAGYTHAKEDPETKPTAAEQPSTKGEPNENATAPGLSDTEEESKTNLTAPEPSASPKKEEPAAAPQPEAPTSIAVESRQATPVSEEAFDVHISGDDIPIPEQEENSIGHDIQDNNTQTQENEARPVDVITVRRFSDGDELPAAYFEDLNEIFGDGPSKKKDEKDENDANDEKKKKKKKKKGRGGAKRDAEKREDSQGKRLEDRITHRDSRDRDRSRSPVRERLEDRVTYRDRRDGSTGRGRDRSRSPVRDHQEQREKERDHTQLGRLEDRISYRDRPRSPVRGRQEQKPKQRRRASPWPPRDITKDVKNPLGGRITYPDTQPQNGRERLEDRISYRDRRDESPDRRRNRSRSPVRGHQGQQQHPKQRRAASPWPKRNFKKDPHPPAARGVFDRLRDPEYRPNVYDRRLHGPTAAEVRLRRGGAFRDEQGSAGPRRNHLDHRREDFRHDDRGYDNRGQDNRRYNEHPARGPKAFEARRYGEDRDGFDVNRHPRAEDRRGAREQEFSIRGHAAGHRGRDGRGGAARVQAGLGVEDDDEML